MVVDYFPKQKTFTKDVGWLLFFQKGLPLQCQHSNIDFTYVFLFRPITATTNSKRTEIPKPSVSQVTHPDKKTDVNSNAYLHPQTTPTEFVPSNVVLRTLTLSPESKCTVNLVKVVL